MKQHSPEITHCAACGKPFKGREKWTLAAWFKCGAPKLSDIVHVRCRHKQLGITEGRQPT